MTRIELAPAVAGDFDRIFDHLAAHDPEAAPARVGEIVDALSLLERHPLIGRSVAGDLRELVIGRRGRGYVALYRHVEAIDTAFVLAIRAQREAGYSHV